MNLAIFGATGATGRHLVEQALEAGHQVRALVRNADGLPIAHPRLRIVVGMLAQPAIVSGVAQGADAVICVLGARKGEASAICTEGARSILQAMNTAGARRLVALSAYGASETRNASLFIRFIRKVIAAKMRDKDGMEALVRDSELDWTLVRPPVLTNGERSGRYRAGTALKPGVTGRLSRADLAAFMLREAAEGTYIGQAVVVSR
ncbi:nucleoside-diphosphate sugar epimerase [Massilia violaceinigra]|uniref:Nucleoside-diphosphate sugar epimerase n=1 Tax=Massilia violaceinigra TaxID=2045208 RepID=A0A2D2DQP6_9BURK|nr:NAD(P)H-binding protein [Massilia violaceinigra]ATQ77305.1 nucleoside-diphosphate sugar epimerase [Massilia violaceinigra]